ncbi:hypothetical protein [Spirosoma oryzicola]|uniref:hypothetical protein n=1 Tax=Spirosoma oryzicola TaxID=2898794 RepID=UPI001E4249C1|nr:hypothetical protein [Spirosoma oryzicola]UHG90096.1 hypothetical protein LQ777_17810 [Spirosoma oryzicola]
MKYLNIIAHFLQGTYAKFGTSANLFRELTVSVLTAVAVAVLVELLTPDTDSTAAEVRDLLNAAIANQRQADEIRAKQQEWKLQGKIDSLTLVLKKRDEQDSLRANGGFSTLDAMRQINSAINKTGRGPARGR